MSELRGQVPGAADAMAGPELIPSEYLQKWQSLVDLMAQLCEVPAGLIMRALPTQIEVLISSRTAGNPYMAHHKADLGTGLYCETVMKSGKPLLVPNALEDADWNTNPDLELRMVAYLGIPLYWREGELFGTICVLDDKTRKFAARYVDLLWHFKGVIENDCRQIQRTRVLEMEQARLREAFLRSEQQQQQFFESFPGMAMFVSNAGRCLAVNQRCCQMVGRPADAICGAHLREVLTEAGWATIASLVGRAASGEAIIEDVVLPLLGSRRRVQLVCVPHDDVASGLNGMYLFGVDQEAQKAAEEALCCSEARLQETQAMAHLGTWELDLVENRLVWSDETFRIFELDRTRFGASYEAFLNLVHPDDRAWVDGAYRTSVQNRMPYEKIVHRLQMPDGRIKYVEERCETFYDGAGRPQRSVGMVQDITDRKQVEEALRASEERFRAAYRNATVGMSITDLSGRIFEVNHALCTILGYSEQELLARTFQSLTHPDDLGHNLDRVQSLLAGETASEVLEKRYIRKDGSLVWAQVGISLIRDAAGAPLYLLAMVQDITDRKQAEEALQLAKFTVDHATDAIYWVGAGAELLDVNEAACVMLGYTKEEFSRMTVHDINPGFQADSWPAFWEETRRKGAASFESVHRTKDGRLIPIDVNVSMLSYQGVECHCAFVRNITHRKLAEEELRRSEELFRAAYHNAAVGMALCDLRGRFLETNAEFCEILGHSEEELRERDFKAVTYPDDISDSVNRVRQLVDGRVLQHVFEKRYVRKNDEIVWAHVGLSAIRDGAGAVTNILAMAQDITARKTAEKVLRDSEQRLIEAQSVARLGSWSWDIPGNRHQWSDEQYRILGFEPGSIQPAFEVFANSVHPDDRAAVVETIQAAIHGDAGFDLTCRIVRPDGEIRHVHCRGEVLRSKLGTPISMTGTVQDSTRQKQTEEMLRIVASEPARFGETKFLGSMLRTLAEGTGAIYALCGKLLPGGLRLRTVAVWSHGAEAENIEYDIAGTPCEPVVIQRTCVHERGVQEKFPNDTMLQVLKADSYIGAPLFGSDDQPIGLLAIIGAQPFEDAEHAITLLQICAGRAGSELERRQIEKVLQSSEERFRLVAEATQDILWDWNVVTGEHWWSPNACEKFGYDPRVERSMDAWTKRLHPEDKERMVTMVEQAVQSNMQSFSAEYRFQLADGTYGHFLDRAHIVRNKSGAALRMIGAMIDVTGPRRAYTSLEEAYRRFQAMSQKLQMVESNERRRLSRELHDEIGQLLTSLKFDLAAFKRSLAGRGKTLSERSQERLARALETTDLLFTRLRQVVRALRPPV